MQLNGLTLAQLATYVAVVRNGSFSRAAEQLFLTQSAVSQRIKHLEGAVGTELFVRNGRVGLALTDTGARLLVFAERIEALTHELEIELRGAPANTATKALTIACGPSFAKYRLPRLLSVFRHEQPDVRVMVQQGSWQVIDEGIRSGLADIGIRGNVHTDEFRVVPMLPDQLVLVGLANRFAPDLSQLALDARGANFIATEPGSPLRDSFDRWSASLGIDAQPVIVVDSMETIKQAVLTGLGVALVAESVVKDELEEGTLIAIPAPGLPLPWKYFILVDSTRPLSPPARAFVDTALQQFDVP